MWSFSSVNANQGLVDWGAQLGQTRSAENQKGVEI